MPEVGDVNNLKERVAQLEEEMKISDEVFERFTSELCDKLDDLNKNMNNKFDALIKLLDERLPKS